MVDSKVVINDEAFDLVTIPDAKSKMVMKTKDLLLGSLDLQSLVDDLGKLGSFIRVAYNGVAGHTEEQIQVQNVGYKVTELADKSAVTVYQFKGASQNILQELKSTYQYLLDGYDDMALKTLSMMTNTAPLKSIRNNNNKSTNPLFSIKGITSFANKKADFTFTSNI